MERHNPWREKRPRRPRHDMRIWHLAKELGLQIYRLTAGFPTEERYGLTSQLRRGCVSVKSNIAEGAARETTREFLRYCYMARGALEEIDSQLEFAGDLGFLDGLDLSGTLKALEDLGPALQGMINALHRSLQK